MSVLRTIGMLLCFAVAAAFAWPALSIFRDVIFPMWDRAHGDYADVSLKVAGLVLTGWAIIGFAAALVLLASAFVAAGVYLSMAVQVRNR